MSHLQPSPESSFTPTGAEAWPFGCVLSHSGRDAAWIRVVGELDIATTPQLELTLEEALRSARLVILDLRQLEFMDSSGIYLLIKADAHARSRGQRLVVVRGPAQIDHLFELVGISDRLEFVDPEALKSVARAPTSAASPDAA
jgi:anti-sigma B factor antagonist